MSNITQEDLEYLGFDCFPAPDGENFYDFVMLKWLFISGLTISVAFIDDDRIVSIEQVNSMKIDLPIKSIDDVELLISLCKGVNNESRIL